MEIPKYIVDKIRKQNEYCIKAKDLEDEIDNWCNVAIKETADEKHLFATHEDAKKYCDEKNNQLKD